MLVSDERPKFEKRQKPAVLILVLVDVGLGPALTRPLSLSTYGLNPCFSGCWSRTVAISGYVDFARKS